MSDKNNPLNNYDPAVRLAYNIVLRLAESGTADTAALPACLSGLIKVIRAAKLDSEVAEERRTAPEPQA